MSNSQEFLNDQEKDTLAGELAMERARATRDIAQLATIFGLAEEQAIGLVAAFRLHAEQFSVTKLDVIHQHAAGLVMGLGDIALHAPVEEQTIVARATDNTPQMKSEVVAWSNTDLEQATEARIFNARTARFMDDIFGDYTTLNLQEADKPAVVDALLALPTTIERTQKVTASLRMRLGLMLAGATNATIATAEGHHDARVLANAFTRFKTTIRDNTLDEARAVLADAVTSKGDSLEPIAVLEVAPVSEARVVSIITHEESAPISAISYTPAVPDKRQQRTKAVREQAAPLSSQPEFDRLKTAVKAALGDSATLLADDMAIDDLAPIIQTAYEQEFGSAESSQFLQYYLKMLRAEDRPRDLFERCAMEPAKISRAARAMPGLIAAVLRGDSRAPTSESVATSPVVTPRLMPTRQQPLTYTPRVRLPDEEWAARQVADTSAKDGVVSQESDVAPVTPSVERDELVAAHMAEATVVAPEVATTPRQIVDRDPRTHDDLREVTLTIIKELDGFTDDEKRALRARLFFGKNRAHADMTNDTRVAIRKVRDHIDERGDAICMPSELTEQTLKYFALGDHNDLDTIYKKLQSSYSEIEIDPRDIERWLGLGLEALFTSQVQSAIS